MEVMVAYQNVEKLRCIFLINIFVIKVQVVVVWVGKEKIWFSM